MINPGTTCSSNMSNIVGTFLLGTSFRTKFPQFPSYKPTTNHYTLCLLSWILDGLGINFPLQIAVSSNFTLIPSPPILTISGSCSEITCKIKSLILMQVFSEQSQKINGLCQGIIIYPAIHSPKNFYKFYIQGGHFSPLLQAFP